MEEEAERRSVAAGWQEWKRAAASLLAALMALGQTRVAMARLEARQWGRAFVLRVALLVGAGFLGLFAFGLLTAGLVAAFQLWTGSLVGALFATFGLYMVSAGAMVFAASRSRAARPVFEATLREIRKDLEDLSGGGQ